MRATWAFSAAIAAACAVMIAPAGLANADSAQETISGLQSKGYVVNIDRIGAGPMSSCIVTGIRNPQTITQLLPYRGPGGHSGRGNSFLIPTIVSQTISVSLDCSHS